MTLLNDMDGKQLNLPLTKSTVNPPSCLDSANERRAIDQGLVVNQVFPENKEYLTQKQGICPCKEGSQPMLLKVDAKALQLEWRVAVELSGDKVGLQEILDGVDSHADNQQRFGLPSRLIAKTYLFRFR